MEYGGNRRRTIIRSQWNNQISFNSGLLLSGHYLIIRPVVWEAGGTELFECRNAAFLVVKSTVNVYRRWQKAELVQFKLCGLRRWLFQGTSVCGMDPSEGTGR